MITTEAWVLYNLQKGSQPPRDLQLEPLSFPDLEPDELLVEPLYGCWEGNMGHAVARKPIDIAYSRGEDRVVIGNAGVVRVLQPGSAAGQFHEGDVCVVCAPVWDQHGFPYKIMGYDAPGTLGLLAKRMKLKANQVVQVPPGTRHSLAQWAAFSVRYVTAWGNWRVAHGCWQAMCPDTPGFEPWVWGWGGGTSFAEVELAKHAGYRTALVSAVPERLRQIEEAGIVPIDRRAFPDLYYDESKMPADRAYVARYRRSEDLFVHTVREQTGGQGVSIFVDQIGAAVLPATVKAVGRPGVITTSGWKTGMKVSLNRAVEAMSWHTHVNTHYARLEDCAPAVAYGEQAGWMPKLDGRIYEWETVPYLAEEYGSGKENSYFPIYRVNPE